MKSILDPSFRYTASFNTDVGKTFARIRRAQREDTQHALEIKAEALVKVSPILRRGRGEPLVVHGHAQALASNLVSAAIV